MFEGGNPERRLLLDVQAAMDNAAEDAEHVGGVRGLLHHMRHPAVQPGLRALSILPTWLERDKRGR